METLLISFLLAWSVILDLSTEEQESSSSGQYMDVPSGPNPQIVGPLESYALTNGSSICPVVLSDTDVTLLQPGLRGVYRTRNLNNNFFSVYSTSTTCDVGAMSSMRCDQLVIQKNNTISRRGNFYVQFTPIAGSQPIEVEVRFGPPGLIYVGDTVPVTISREMPLDFELRISDFNGVNIPESIVCVDEGAGIFRNNGMFRVMLLDTDCIFDISNGTFSRPYYFRVTLSNSNAVTEMTELTIKLVLLDDCNVSDERSKTLRVLVMPVNVITSAPLENVTDPSNVTEFMPTGPESPTNNVGLIAGVTFAAVLVTFVIIILAVIICVLCKKGRCSDVESNQETRYISVISDVSDGEKISKLTKVLQEKWDAQDYPVDDDSILSELSNQRIKKFYIMLEGPSEESENNSQRMQLLERAAQNHPQVKHKIAVINFECERDSERIIKDSFTCVDIRHGDDSSTFWAEAADRVFHATHNISANSADTSTASSHEIDGGLSTSSSPPGSGGFPDQQRANGTRNGGALSWPATRRKYHVSKPKNSDKSDSSLKLIMDGLGAVHQIVKKQSADVKEIKEMSSLTNEMVENQSEKLDNLRLSDQ